MKLSEKGFILPGCRPFSRIWGENIKYRPVPYRGGISENKKQTEEKAKVVAAVWGTELIQFLATLDIFYQDDFEKKDEYRLLGRRDALKKLRIILFTSYQTTTLPKWMFSQKLLFKSSLLLNSKCGIQVYIPKQKRWPFPSLLSLSFFYDAISCSYTQN